MSHEWPIYVFDATLMAAALAICSTWYLGSDAFESVGPDVEMMVGNSSHNQ